MIETASVAKKGCLDGCYYNKEIKLPEMKENYLFRCEAGGCYMKKKDIKKTCRHFKLPYKVSYFTIEDFLSEFD